MKSKHRRVFEESVGALKKIDLPQFIHTLYLYSAGAVNIIGLKPSSRGLYELSETIHALLKTKSRVIIAVNGDSGTGKTYFCQSLEYGFGNLTRRDILYLMRDRKKDQKTFNRLLGLSWLKKHIDPVYYQDYPFSSEEDDPDVQFQAFLEDNEDKKLIILDGCRDQNYFQRVVDLFYFRGLLDIEVNFRALPSTRRRNLEEREIALESVKTHLSFLEEPALEDTHLYQYGLITVYDLDNSIDSRLNREEIRELFQKSRVDDWQEMIRLGSFSGPRRTVEAETRKWDFSSEKLFLDLEPRPAEEKRCFFPEEKRVQAEVNGNLTAEPNLLQIIPADDLEPSMLKFYAQDQLCGIGRSGSLFILSLLDNHIFYTFLENSRCLTLLGRDIFLADREGGFFKVSFEKNEILFLGLLPAPVTAAASIGIDKVVTGHSDGSLRIWDFQDRKITLCRNHDRPLTALTTDYFGRIYAGSEDGTVLICDLERRSGQRLSGPYGTICHLKACRRERLLVVSEKKRPDSKKHDDPTAGIGLIDTQNGSSEWITAPIKGSIKTVSTAVDGRIIAGIDRAGRDAEAGGSSLLILDPGLNGWESTNLSGHSEATMGCLLMGPRIITCGRDENRRHSFRLWGTKFYVRRMADKLSLQKGW
jgi:uridine kinase